MAAPESRPYSTGGTAMACSSTIFCSPMTYAKQLHGHLLEVHGTSDDNVHMQNTMQMINAFIDAGKQFDLLLYPRKTHAISGAAARIHLYTRIRDHFRRELLGERPDE